MRKSQTCGLPSDSSASSPTSGPDSDQTTHSSTKQIWTGCEPLRTSESVSASLQRGKPPTGANREFTPPERLALRAFQSDSFCETAQRPVNAATSIISLDFAPPAATISETSSVFRETIQSPRRLLTASPVEEVDCEMELSELHGDEPTNTHHQQKLGVKKQSSRQRSKSQSSAGSAPAAPTSQKTPQFAEKSLFFITRDNVIRKAACKLITWQWFERFSILVIVLNCICLGANDPCDSDCVTPKCQALAYAEHAIFSFFFVEMLLKMFAMGVVGANSYLAETWNRFDFFIVGTGIIEYIFVEEDLNISAIRAFRVFRPLRAITRIPSLRLLILLLLDTMPMLGNVLLFCCLVFFVFGIAGVQLLAGVLRHRCFFPLPPSSTNGSLAFMPPNENQPPSFMPAYYHRPDGDYICSPGEGILKCNEIPLYEQHDSMCAELFGLDSYEARLCRDWVANYTECRPDGPNPAKGSLSFDHIGAAWMAIFQVISLEGWTKVMYYVQDSYSFWIWIYFLMLVVTGSFFAVNLCLVVIATQFSETKRREMSKMKTERRLERKQSLTSRMTMSTNETETDQGNFYTQIYDIIAQLINSIVDRIIRCNKQQSMAHRQRRSAVSETSHFGGFVTRQSVNEAELTDEDNAAVAALALPSSPTHTLPVIQPGISTATQTATGDFCSRLVDEIDLNRKMARSLLEHNIVTGLVITVIVVNAVLMGMEHHGQPEALSTFFQVTDPVFSVFFAIEVFLKIYAYGFPLYVRDAMNLLDLITVCLNIYEMTSGHGSKLSVIRTFRILRVLKIVRFLPQLQRQLYVMLRTIDNIATFFILLSFFLFIFALLGMSLFGCRFCPYYEKPGGGRVGRTTTPSSAALAGAGGTTVADRWLMDKDGVTCLLKVLSLDGNFVSIPLADSEAKESEAELTPMEKHLMAYYTCPRANFDSLLLSLFTVLQVFTQDAWSLVLIDGVYYGSDWAGLYFVALVTVGNYVLFNLLVAILVEGFSQQGEEGSTSGSRQSMSRQLSSVAPIGRNGAPEIIVERCESQPDPLSQHGLSLINEEIGEVPYPVVVGSVVKTEPSRADPMTTSRMSNEVPLAYQSAFTPARMRQSLRNALKVFQRRKDYSLYVLSSTNPFRRRLLKVVMSSEFDNFILLFILANCCAIMVERPAIKRDSFERYCLDIANYVFNALFLAEALAKITAMGLLIGPNAYLKSGWNVLDFFLVNCSTVYTALEIFSPRAAETKILEIFRVLRLLRALRPLRVVNRAPGLKIVVETLLLSIKPIGNVIIICLTFFLIFSILGVQLFQGCFYECRASKVDLADGGPQQPGITTVATLLNISKRIESGEIYSPDRAQLKVYELLYGVKTKDDCIEQGFSWENESLNFDNILQALMTLFVFATFDGWIDITRDAIDCVGVDLQPVRDYNPWNVIYFISFLLIVCFFILNMFVGVVVHNFQKVQERVHAEFKAKRLLMKQEKLLNRLRKRARMSEPKQKLLVKLTKKSLSPLPNEVNLDVLTVLDPNAPTPTVTHPGHPEIPAVTVTVEKSRSDVEDLSFLEEYPFWRLKIYQIFTHTYFELALAAITAINILVMAVEFYQMPSELQFAVRIIGYVFTGLLVLEVIAKIAAFGFWRYVRDRWNQLDVAIVALSIGAIYLEDAAISIIPVNPTIIRVARIVRIARVFKLLKTAAGIRRLLDTVGRALPQVGNLALFFLLLFFIYASLGVELFGKFECVYTKCEGLSRHANYANFGMALLTLFRIFTGDDWNGILKDMLRISSDKDECAALMKSAASASPTRDFSMECSMAGFLAPFYFVSFVLLAQFVLINVVVAVLMNELEEAHRRDAMDKLSRQIEEEEEENIEQKVAVVEGVVKTACQDLIAELQAKLGTSTEDVIGIVSTEYVLREAERAEEERYLESQGFGANLMVDDNSSRKTTSPKLPRHRPQPAVDQATLDLLGSRPVLLASSDSMQTLAADDKALRRKLREEFSIGSSTVASPPPSASPSGPLFGRRTSSSSPQRKTAAAAKADVELMSRDLSRSSVMAVDQDALEQIFHDLGLELKPVVMHFQHGDGHETPRSQVVEEFVEQHRRRLHASFRHYKQHPPSRDSYSGSLQDHGDEAISKPQRRTSSSAHHTHASTTPTHASSGRHHLDGGRMTLAAKAPRQSLSFHDFNN